MKWIKVTIATLLTALTAGGCFTTPEKLPHGILPDGYKGSFLACAYKGGEHFFNCPNIMPIGKSAVKPPFLGRPQTAPTPTENQIRGYKDLHSSINKHCRIPETTFRQMTKNRFVNPHTGIEYYLYGGTYAAEFKRVEDLKRNHCEYEGKERDGTLKYRCGGLKHAYWMNCVKSEIERHKRQKKTEKTD